MMKTRTTTLPMALLCGSLLCASGLAPANDAARFDHFDSDGNGNVSSTEHTDAARAMFTAMDADADQRVTAAEMKAYHAQSGQQETDGLSAEAKISQIDENRDGVVSATEHETASRAKFAEMDNNNDGALSLSEFDLGHAQLRHG